MHYAEVVKLLDAAQAMVDVVNPAEPDFPGALLRIIEAVRSVAKQVHDCGLDIAHLAERVDDGE